MGKSLRDDIKTLSLSAPEPMEYYVNIENSKDRKKFIDRVEKIVRSSMEYRDYIQYLKENVDMNRCIFFQNVMNNKGSGRGRISIEVHHEPFTLFDYVDVVINKYQEEGLPINDLTIADEVLELHYSNKVGLVPLSKTMHQMAHKSSKIIIPLNMCYGEYSKFLDEYQDYISDDLYDKLERKMDMTNNLTEESFEALKREFTYIEVNGFEELNKMERRNSEIA